MPRAFKSLFASNMRTCSVVILLVLTGVKSQELQPGISENLSEDHEAITNALSDIILTLFYKATSVLNILTRHHSADIESHYILSDILSKTLLRFDSRVTVVMEENRNLHRRDRMAAYNIILVDTYRSFKKVFALLNPDDLNLQGYFIIVFTRRDE